MKKSYSLTQGQNTSRKGEWDDRISDNNWCTPKRQSGTYLLPCAPAAGDVVDPGFLPSRLARCDSRASRRLLGALVRDSNDEVK